MFRKSAVSLSFFAVAQLLLLAPLSSWADVIPTRPGARTARQRKREVASALAHRGVDPRAAAAQVNEMAARDLEYFAAEPKRVRLAAGLLLEEWLLAGLFVGVLGIIAGIALLSD